MDVQFNVQGKERKRLVEQIANIVQEDFKYLKAPSFAYQIGEYFRVDKVGTLQIDESADSNKVENLFDKLKGLGFVFEPPQLTEATVEDESRNDQSILEISVQVENFGEQEETNLNNLISSKSGLLKKAIGTVNLDYRIEENKITFPWFVLDDSREEAQAYQQLVVALINKAKTSKRIRPVEKETENEKFTFRVFLIGLGMIGDEYKVARKILMKNLSGNAAYKNGGKDHVSK